MRVALVAALVLLTSTARAVRPADEHECDRPGAARFEVAPWLALGTGVRSRDGTQTALGTMAMDVGITLPVAKHLRLGGWSSHGTSNFSSFDVAGGARVEAQTNDFNGEDSALFGVRGRYSFILDAGAGHRFGREGDRGAFFALRLAAGFTAPNLLYSLYGKPPQCDCGSPNEAPGLCRPTAGVVAGARPFVLFHRAVDGGRTEITAGIEFEVIGAGWWMFSR